MSNKVQYETNLGRVFLAMLAGAITGGFTFTTVTSFLAHGFSISIEDYFSILALTTGYALIIIALLGGPVWLLLHKLGWRQWHAAVAAGVIIPAIVILVIGRGVPDAGILDLILVSVRMFGVFGAVVAFVVWRVAYRKEHTSETS